MSKYWRTAPLRLPSYDYRKERKPVDSNSRGVPDSTTQGEPSSLLSWFIDITTHKRSMPALQPINQQAVTLLESMTDGFIALDREWRYVYVNRRTEQLSGRTREELLGKNHWEVHPEAVGTLFDTMLPQAMDGQVQVDFESYYPPSQCWYDVHVYPTQDVLCIYYCDITARKKAEEELRAFKLISDQANDGRSEEHTSELQSLAYLVCRLLLEKKKK